MFIATNGIFIMEALFYERVNDSVRCLLCPHQCLIKKDHTGICLVRRNKNGTLLAETYGHLSAVNFDPIEKKPLYHYYPGKFILSLGSVGCNMKCRCCQNWNISQVSADDFSFGYNYEPQKIVDLASSRSHNIGVAYTYNEPCVWFEFMIDIARLVRLKGMKNVMVSNGYIQDAPLKELLQYMDAFNIDLKAFSEEFYRKIAGATLQPVLNTLQTIKQWGKHLEITNLVIPTLNDDPDKFRDMIDWINNELGSNTVLHLSRYHPMYKLNIESTPEATLEKLYAIAREKLNYVYVGNINMRDYQDTKCNLCGKRVISRYGYHIEIKALTDNGLCAQCGNQITDL
jgi:pyruvate formate lyase activating enzyme